MIETINLSRSKQLMELPNFSMTRKLETVYLDFCDNLRRVHPSILSHTLVNLDVSYCLKLESLESEAHLKSLSDLRVDGCGSLKKFCLSIQKVERLDLFTSDKIEILHLPIIGQLTELKELFLTGSRLRSLPMNEFCCLTNLERSILGIPPTLDQLEATDCTLLETVFCSSLFEQEFLGHGCLLDFKNCAKLDEPSLVIIEKLIQCSIIKAAKRDDYYTASYSGSRVPNWMRYKQMDEEASNTIEFTCNDEQSLIGMVFCCVLPSTPVDMTICCNYSDDSSLKFKSQYFIEYYFPESYNSDNIFIWYYNFPSNYAQANYHGRITCEFSATERDDDIEFIDSEISIKTCGVSPLYSSKRMRIAHAEEIVSIRKQKHHREMPFP